MTPVKPVVPRYRCTITVNPYGVTTKESTDINDLFGFINDNLSIMSMVTIHKLRTRGDAR